MPRPGSIARGLALLAGCAILAYLAITTYQEIALLNDGESASYEIHVWKALSTHLHNKAVHAPIGFALVTFLFAFLSIWRKEFRRAAQWSALVTLISFIPSIVTGLEQATVYEGASREWVVVAHRAFGFSAAVLWGGWTLVLWRSPGRIWERVLALLALAMLAVTGFLGGVIAHG
jgi:hypothetical protein